MAALAYFVTTLRAKFEEKEKGATAVEYGLIVAVVSVVILLALFTIGDDIVAAINDGIADLQLGGAAG